LCERGKKGNIQPTTNNTDEYNINSGTFLFLSLVIRCKSSVCSR